jgi:hypothetical protein
MPLILFNREGVNLKCKKCGREIPDSSIYCIFCGVRLKLNYSEYISDQTGVIDLDKLPNEMKEKDEFDDLFYEYKRKNKLRELEEILFSKWDDDLDM